MCGHTAIGKCKKNAIIFLTQKQAQKMSGTFAKRLRESRESKGKTQQQMAEMLGITAVSYGAWERGKTEPSLPRLVRLCRFFGVTSDWLIGIEEERKPILDARLVVLKEETDRAMASVAKIATQISDIEKVMT